ncbi:MAG: hypothetical protein JWN67_1845 [Actinomycetia bacterium]|nr:hypothetical protein [Actinomycetes bacterium]
MARPTSVLGTRGRLLVALPALLGLLALVAPPAGAMALRNEGFERSDWWHTWGMAKAPFRTAVVTEGTSSFLRIGIPAGAHEGTSFFAPTGDADRAVLKYRIRISESLDPSVSAFNVKMPGFGKPDLDATGGCIAGCGGSPTDGSTAYSARTDLQSDGRPGFYIYDVDAAKFGRGQRWTLPNLSKGVWHAVELRITMNTPGQRDGWLTSIVDGTTAYEAHDIEFRTTASLHVGAAWFDFYYGGTGLNPRDAWFDVDDMSLSVS